MLDKCETCAREYMKSECKVLNSCSYRPKSEPLEGRLQEEFNDWADEQIETKCSNLSEVELLIGAKNKIAEILSDIRKEFIPIAKAILYGENIAKAQRDASLQWHKTEVDRLMLIKNAEIIKLKKNLEAQKKEWVEKCGHCDTPLLREGELYQKLDIARKEWANNMADWLKTWWASLSYSTTYYEELQSLIAELRQMSEK